MATIKKPLVWDGDKHHHRELTEDQELISGRHVHLHDHEDNLLGHGPDGGLLVLHPEHEAVDPADLISSDSPNLIQQGSDGKLHARVPRPGDFLSSADGNNLVVSSEDQKLYVGDPHPGNLISENANNAITLGTDHKLFAPVVDAPHLISSNGGNDLHLGTDGELYINVNEQLKIDAADQILTKSALGIRGNVKLNFLHSSRTLQLEGKNGTIISEIVLPEAGSALENAYTEDNPANQAPGHYLVMVFKTSLGTDKVYVDLSHLVDIYTPADASIDISDYAIKVNLDPDSPLKLSADGIRIDYLDMLSTDLNNGLGVGSDGKLVVNQPPLADNISGNAGNILILGSDGKYYVPTTVVPVATSIHPKPIILWDSNSSLPLLESEDYFPYDNLIHSGANMQGDPGTSTEYARADHRHPPQPFVWPASGSSHIPKKDSGTGVTGSDSTYFARRDHQHPLQVSTTLPKALGTAGVGTATDYARADHVHPMVTLPDSGPDPATTAPPKDAASGTVGTSSLYARADHSHPLNVTTTLPVGDATTGLVGTSTAYARADHRHPSPLLSFVGVTQTDISTGDYGSKTNYYARGDHRHPLNVATGGLPAANGTASRGTSNFYARFDHVHPSTAGGGLVSYLEDGIVPSFESGFSDNPENSILTRWGSGTTWVGSQPFLPYPYSHFDFNTMTDPGYWFLRGDRGAGNYDHNLGSMDNTPVFLRILDASYSSLNSFTLRVERDTTAGFVLQTVRVIEGAVARSILSEPPLDFSGMIYQRHCVNGTWSRWTCINGAEAAFGYSITNSIFGVYGFSVVTRRHASVFDCQFVDSFEGAATKYTVHITFGGSDISSSTRATYTLGGMDNGGFSIYFDHSNVYGGPQYFNVSVRSSCTIPGGYVGLTL